MAEIVVVNIGTNAAPAIAPGQPEMEVMTAAVTPVSPATITSVRRRRSEPIGLLPSCCMAQAHIHSHYPSVIESLSHATLSAEGRCLRVALLHAFLLPGRSLRSPHVTSTAYACERGGASLKCGIYYNFLRELLRTPYIGSPT